MIGKSFDRTVSIVSSLSCTALDTRAWRTKIDTDDSQPLLGGSGVRNRSLARWYMTSPIDRMIALCSRDTWLRVHSAEDVGPRYAMTLQNISRGSAANEAFGGGSVHAAVPGVTGRGARLVRIILQLMNRGGTIEACAAAAAASPADFFRLPFAMRSIVPRMHEHEM